MGSTRKNTRSFFPSSNSTKPFRRNALHELDSHRSTENLPAVCDILIIGGGYAGIATAYHLLNGEGTNKSVLLLEAREACSGATVRNGGHLRPQVYMNLLDNAESFGEDAATELVDFEAAHIPAIREVVEKEGINCDFLMTKSFDVAMSDETAQSMKEYYDKLTKTMPGRAAEVQYTSSEDAEEVSGVKGAKACYSFPSASLSPYKFIMSLLIRALRKGLNLQTHTPVHEISEFRSTYNISASASLASSKIFSSSAGFAGIYSGSGSASDGSDEEDEGHASGGNYWAVSTTRGEILASKIIIATNAYTSAIAPQYARKIIPVRGICTHLNFPVRPASGSEKKPPRLQNTYVLYSQERGCDYLLPRPDGSIIVGEARSTFLDERRWWQGVVNGELIKPDKAYFDGYMQRHFYGWDDSAAFVDSVWTRIMGYSTDGRAHIGAVPDKPSQFLLVGFNGHGMPLIYLAAKGIAAIVRDNVSYEESGIPMILKTTQERLYSDEDILAEENPAVDDESVTDEG